MNTILLLPNKTCDSYLLHTFITSLVMPFKFPPSYNPGKSLCGDVGVIQVIYKDSQGNCEQMTNVQFSFMLYPIN